MSYHEITNEELKSVISDYIDKGKNYGLDKDDVCISVILEKMDLYSNTAYIYMIRRFIEDEILTEYNHPMLLCKPIKNKKIFLITGLDKFANVHIPDLGNYIEDKNSSTYSYYKFVVLDAYKENLKRKKEKNNELIFLFDWIHYNGMFLYAYFNAEGKLIDTTYVDYNVGTKKRF